MLRAQREGVAGAPALQIFPEAPLAFFWAAGRRPAAADGSDRPSSVNRHTTRLIPPIVFSC